ncbi:huntingtin-interacting protein 1 [Drosophila miranda]|uniref:huntingtin-interacting protein 1 n=1 Tax=Drosophila miranda TaxID=7229 RepID=UPI00143F216A|nr:huntingtin-interacting protein 1 [Drosophila miranda]
MSTLAEKDIYQLVVSTNKALNGMEAPLKTKHARSIIIMIHKTKEAKSFWNTISRQPLMQSRFTAWKFCHLLHKVLREAPPSAIKHSQSHKKMILEVGKMWGLLHNDIGLCINAYCKLLVTKLNFHEKNTFPGSLIISFKEISKAADRDLNYFFQLCVEIFDYLEDIIALQLQIFSSINTYRMSSMTQQGQCRLAPMICLIQDSNSLYDNSVRIMFKLHENLPNDVLSGHRDRFNGLFLKLKVFYENVRPLQYFKSLISVPELPESSPNFSSQVDFSSYIPPVVYVQPEPDPIVEDLVETSCPSEPDNSQTQQQLNTLESIINEKDAMIEELKLSLNSLQQNFDELGQSYQHEVLEMQKANALLSNDLLISRQMCENIRMQNDDLELQLNKNPMLIQKVMEEEEKQKQSSEKFNKLKLLYTQIRDEHIKLLREQSESTKVLNKEKQTNSELLLQTKVLNNEILKIKGDVEEKNKTNFDLLQQIEDQKEQLSQLESVRNEIKEQFDNVVKQKEIQELDSISTSERLSENSLIIEKLNASLNEAQEKVSIAESQISLKNEEILQHLKAHETEKETLLSQNEQLKLEHKATFEDQNKQLLETINSLKQKETSLQELTEAFALLKQEFDNVTKQKEIQELDSISTSERLNENSLVIEKLNASLNEAQEKVSIAESQISLKNEEILQHLKAHETEKETLLSQNEQLKLEHKATFEDQNKQLLETINSLKQKETSLQELTEAFALLKQEFDNVTKQKEIQELDSISTSERLNENSLVIEKLNASLNEAQEKVSIAESQISLKNEEILQHLKAHEAEKETLLSQNEQLKLEHKATFEDQNKQLLETINSLKQKETSLQESTVALTLLKQEQLSVTQQYEDLQGRHAALEEKFHQTTKQVDSITESYENCHSNLNDVRKLVVQTVKDICNSKLSDSAEQPLDAIPKITTEMDGLIVTFISSPDLQKATSIKGLQAAMFFGYAFIKLYEQCDVVYKSTTEIETGQDILMKASSICSDICTFFQYSLNDEPREKETHKALSDVQSKLSDIRKLVDKIKQTFEKKIDFDKLLEIELREMDSAIDEAASKIINLLAKAREKDDKTNLEVNGKIVDACTTLMECVKVLILKSRVLQQEIVASQKGNASANEFYRRNSQWSDGLISASKSVAKAANYLVDAANNAIESESGKNFELIVAAQEIAACTAQMVIASKVKANRNSQNLTDLTKASRNVTKATGTLVATVKDCNSQLEELNEKELSNLTPSQIKTMEMEIHVKVLETEQALQTQRLKLSAFRREHYKNTDY